MIFLYRFDNFRVQKLFDSHQNNPIPLAIQNSYSSIENSNLESL